MVHFSIAMFSLPEGNPKIIPRCASFLDLNALCKNLAEANLAATRQGAETADDEGHGARSAAVPENSPEPCLELGSNW